MRGARIVVAAIRAGPVVARSARASRGPTAVVAAASGRAAALPASSWRPLANAAAPGSTVGPTATTTATGGNSIRGLTKIMSTLVAFAAGWAAWSYQQTYEAREERNAHEKERNAREKATRERLLTFHEDCRNLKVGAIELALRQDPSLANSVQGGLTALQRAAMFSDRSIEGLLVISALLEAGADPSATGTENILHPQSTPLHYAVRESAGTNSWGPDVVEALLKHGACVHARDEQGKTPLQKAVDKECGDGKYAGLIVHELLKADADLDRDGDPIPLFLPAPPFENNEILDALKAHERTRKRMPPVGSKGGMFFVAEKRC